MTDIYIAELEIVVAGEPGNGKTNFIKRFLEIFPPSAEMRKRNQTVYCLYQPDLCLRIQLRDVNSVENMDRIVYDNMDVLVFYHAANDPKSLQSLEKWIRLMRVDAKKEVLSILLADWGNLGCQRDAAKNFAQQANMLKDFFGMELALQSSSEDQESAFKVIQIITCEIPLPKTNKKFSFQKKSFQARAVSSRDMLDLYLNKPSTQNSSNCGEMARLEFSLQELQV